MQKICLVFVLAVLCSHKSEAQTTGIPLDKLLEDVFNQNGNGNPTGGGSIPPTGGNGGIGPGPGPGGNGGGFRPGGGGGNGGGIIPTQQPTPAPPTEGPSYAECGANKICVPFYNCKNDTGGLNTDGENLLDIRIDETSPCPSYLETCCSLGDKTTGVPLPKPNPSEIHKNCGMRNAEGILFRITGNKQGETEYGEFPWMVAVLKQERAGDEILNIYQCGGSIIHPQVVLTAAHCVHKNSAHDLLVRAGEWDTQTKDEVYREQDRQVIEIVMHEKFSKAGLHNDVALLFIAQEFDLGEDVNTVCLPPPQMHFDQARCFTTGWGKDVFGQKGKYQVILKKIDVPVVPHDVCQAKLRETRLGKFYELDKSFLCAGGEVGKDACKGDGGGPLSCPIPGIKGKYYQAGIVAWGVGCGGTTPGVYADVSYLRPWIDNVMTSRNFDAAYYTPK